VLSEGEENCGKRGHGCFIMAILQLIMRWAFGSFLAKPTLLYWSTHPSFQIWPLVTSFCFPNLMKSSKELVFKNQKPLKKAKTKEFPSDPGGILSGPYGIGGSCMDEITFSVLWHHRETKAQLVHALLLVEQSGSYN